MRRIALALMSTVAVVVLLFGYRTSSPHFASTATVAVAAGTGGTNDSTGSSSSAAPSTQPSATSSSSASSGSSASSSSTPAQTVAGQAVQTRFGPVQVQITVSGGKLTAVTVLQVPNSNGRDVSINNRAVPVLNQEALKAQSANIDSVSGATYTSDGYIGSLQSALDKAGL